MNECYLCKCLEFPHDSHGLDEKKHEILREKTGENREIKTMKSSKPKNSMKPIVKDYWIIYSLLKRNNLLQLKIFKRLKRLLN